jgi:hypothetical protein
MQLKVLCGDVGGTAQCDLLVIRCGAGLMVMCATSLLYTGAAG